jgi:glutathione S-transferase
MRLRPIEQMAAKVAVALEDGEPDMATFVRQRLPNIRHQMWNGQWRPAIARMKTIYQGTAQAITRIGHAAGEHMQRFRKHLRDLRDYLVNNQTSLTNYAHAYRNGLRISSAPADLLDRRRCAPAASGTLRST